MEQKTQEKIVIGSQLAKTVKCSMCGKEGKSDQFFTLRDKKGSDIFLCAECKEKTNKVFEEETKNINFVRAIIVGVLGGIVGGIVWYLVAVGLEREIGYISLGLGYLVGLGVWWGAGKKRGHNLQIISALITIVAIIITEKFSFDYFLNQYIQSHISEFPNAVGQTFSASFFSPELWQSMVSPIGLLIYAIGIYVAYRYCKPRRI